MFPGHISRGVSFDGTETTEYFSKIILRTPSPPSY